MILHELSFDINICETSLGNAFGELYTVSGICFVKVCNIDDNLSMVYCITWRLSVHIPTVWNRFLACQVSGYFTRG